MGNITLQIKTVPFHSPSYHILLYGINDIGPKLDDFLTKNKMYPILADENGNLPMICLSKIKSVINSEINLKEILEKDALIGVSELSNALRFVDQNTLQPHYELILINLKKHDPEIILGTINLVVHMLRIRGFKFITPLILSKPFYKFFENPGKVMIANYEDVGLTNLDTKNVMLTCEDCEWVYDNLPWFFNQIISKNNSDFQLPLEMLYASIFSNSERAKLASLWIGIESLIKTNDSEIGKTMKKSLKLFGGISGNKAKDYWGDSLGRCKVIHGVVSETKSLLQLEERVNEVRDVFCTMLQYFIKNEIIPNRENIYNILSKEILDEKNSEICPNCDSQLICLKCSSGLN